MWQLIRRLARKSRPPQPEVTVLMATLNAKRLVEATIASVLSQQGVRVEMIVCDGLSSDGTLEALAAYGDRIQIHSRADRGVYDALNHGTALAKGRFIMILGAGDRLREGVLKSLLLHAPTGRHPLIYGDVFMEDLDRRYGGAWTAERFRKENLCQQGILYERGIFSLLGGFQLKYPILADYAFNIQCFGHRSIQCVYVNEIVADYLGDGLSANNRDEAFMEDRAMLVHQHLGLPLKPSKPRTNEAPA